MKLTHADIRELVNDSVELECEVKTNSVTLTGKIIPSNAFAGSSAHCLLCIDDLENAALYGAARVSGLKPFVAVLVDIDRLKCTRIRIGKDVPIARAEALAQLYPEMVVVG